MIKFFINTILYPAMHIIKGNNVRQIKNQFLKTQYANDLPQLQKEKLEKLLLHCVENIEYYKNLGITEAEIKNDPFSVLETKIKPLTKLDFKESREQFIDNTVPKEKIIQNMTGGTGGIPMHFCMTREQVETYEAARFRGLSWYGLSEGSSSIMIWGNPFDLSNVQLKKHQRKEKYLKNRQVISVYNVSNEDIKKYVDLMNSVQPEFIYGYSMMVATYAKQMEEAGLTLNFIPKAVIATSEMLYEEQQQLIERVFKCKVAKEYGSRDSGILAFSCTADNLHITAENCIIEVLNPTTLENMPDGEKGIFAITDLNNYVEPRLRYLVGDAGSLTSKMCSCGLKLPLIESLDGRDDVVLTRPDGSFVHATIVINLARHVDGIKEYQFIMHSPTEATFEIVSATNAPLDTAKVVAEIEEQLGLTITVKYTDAIPVAKSGKRRSIIKEY